jgi:uncharacterized NAD(P)/FAD-binding protein YdhS
VNLQPDLLPVPTNAAAPSLAHLREHLDAAVQIFRTAIDEVEEQDHGWNTDTTHILSSVLDLLVEDGDENRAFRAMRLHTPPDCVDRFAPHLRAASRAWHALQQEERRSLRLLKSPL